MNVAILGASPNQSRYSYQAVKLLQQKNYSVFPVNPTYDTIEEISCYKNLVSIEEDIDTVTVYLNPQRLISVVQDIIAKKPKRVILNPGAESSEAGKLLADSGIEVIEACTLVMLKTGQF